MRRGFEKCGFGSLSKAPNCYIDIPAIDTDTGQNGDIRRTSFLVKLKVRIFSSSNLSDLFLIAQLKGLEIPSPWRTTACTCLNCHCDSALGDSENVAGVVGREATPIIT